MSYNQSFNMMKQNKQLNPHIAGSSALYMNRVDYNIDKEEQNLQHQINPRQNIIQARSYVQVVEVNDNPASNVDGSDAGSDFTQGRSMRGRFAPMAPVAGLTAQGGQANPSQRLKKKGTGVTSSDMDSHVTVKISPVFLQKELNI